MNFYTPSHIFTEEDELQLLGVAGLAICVNRSQQRLQVFGQMSHKSRLFVV